MEKSEKVKITLREFKATLAQRETVWLRDQSTGKIVARDGRRLRRFRDVTVTGVYPALTVEGDGSTARSVLVCWGSHDEIMRVDRGKRRSRHGSL